MECMWLDDGAWALYDEHVFFTVTVIIMATGLHLCWCTFTIHVHTCTYMYMQLMLLHANHVVQQQPGIQEGGVNCWLFMAYPSTLITAVILFMVQHVMCTQKCYTGCGTFPYTRLSAISTHNYGLCPCNKYAYDLCQRSYAYMYLLCHTYYVEGGRAWGCGFPFLHISGMEIYS
jgi:hypothetical protein